jgi:hypothetical protein
MQTAAVLADYCVNDSRRTDVVPSLRVTAGAAVFRIRRLLKPVISRNAVAHRHVVARFIAATVY